MSKSNINSTLRKTVAERANDCCEYCLVPRAVSIIRFHIDHIIPEKQGGESIAHNLAYSCQHCNIHKGASIAAYSKEWDTIIPLFNPRKEKWEDHFSLQSSGRIDALTAKAQGTIKILKLNHLERIARRKLLREQGLV